MNIDDKFLLEGAFDLLNHVKDSKNSVISELIGDAFKMLDTTWIERTLHGDDSMLVAIENLQNARKNRKFAQEEYNHQLQNSSMLSDNLLSKADRELHYAIADVYHFECEKEELFESVKE